MPFSYTLVFLQAGKHRLFLNILLCGKLRFPIWRRPGDSPAAAVQALPRYSPAPCEAQRAFLQISPYRSFFFHLRFVVSAVIIF